jgi:hypothetical protein
LFSEARLSFPGEDPTHCESDQDNHNKNPKAAAGMGRKRSNEKGKKKDGQKVHAGATAVNQRVPPLLRALMPVATTSHDQFQASLPYGDDHLAYSLGNSGCDAVEDCQQRVDHPSRAAAPGVGVCGQSDAAEATSICFRCREKAVNGARLMRPTTFSTVSATQCP